MLFDKTLMLGEDTAFDSPGPIVDLEAILPARAAHGQVLPVYFTGKNLTGVDPFQIVLEDSLDGTTWTSISMQIGVGIQGIVDHGVSFALPSNVSRFIRLGITGFTGGTFTAGIVMDALMGA